MTNWDIFDQTFVIQKTIKRVIYRHVMSYAWLFFKSQVIFLEQRLYFHEKKVHVRVVSHLLAKRLSKGRNLAPCSHCKLPCPINYNGWFSAQVSYLTMWWIYLKKIHICLEFGPFKGIGLNVVPPHDALEMNWTLGNVTFRNQTLDSQLKNCH